MIAAFVALSVIALLSLFGYFYAGMLASKGQTVVPAGSRAPALWGIGDAALVIAIFLAAQILATLAAVTGARMLGLPPDGQMTTFLYILSFYAANGLTLIVVLLYALRGFHPLRALGLGARPLGVSARAGAILALLFVPIQFGWPFLIAVLWRIVFNSDPPQEEAVKLFLSAEWPLLLVLIFVAVVLAPALEEIVFRAFVQRGIESRLGTPAAVLITAMLFAVMHGGVAVGIMLLPVALALGVVYAYTRNLVVVIVFHGLFNAMSVLVALAAAGGASGGG